MSGEHTVLRYNRIPFHAAEGETILQRVERHWEQMCSKDGLPSRASLSPEPLDTALSHCFILERVAPEVARFRVAGRDLTELLGVEARGMPLSALFTVPGREALGPLIEQVVDGPHIVEVPLHTSRGFARMPAKGRLLMLPLADRDGQPTRIFGALITDSQPGRHAWRFDLDRAVPLRCKRVFSVMRRRAEPVSQSPVTSIASTPEPERPTFGRRPHLRLVVDNTATKALA